MLPWGIVASTGHREVFGQYIMLPWGIVDSTGHREISVWSVHDVTMGHSALYWS